MSKDKIKKIPVIGAMVKILGGFLRTYREKWKTYRLYLTHKKYQGKNIALKGTLKNTRCFIVATGPSINTQDLSGLENEYCISLSNFFIHEKFSQIKPAFHLFVQSHSPITDEQWAVWWKDAEKHFPSGQKILAASVDRYVAEDFTIFKNQDVYYYSIGQKKLRPRDTIDLTKQLPMAQTSAQIGIYLACYMGIKEIYLIGCDHDWIKHVGESRHFYDEKKSALMQTGYNEWTKGGASKFEFALESTLKLWKRYGEIAEYAHQHGIKIYNATPGSLLDVFPRVQLEDVLKNK